MSLFATGTSWEGLLALFVFFLLSALSNWMKKKSGQTEEDSGGEPHPGPPPAARKPGTISRTIVLRPGSADPQQTVDWQEELRRLLQGEPPAPPAPPPLAVPPPVHRPMPGAAARPVLVDSSESARALASLAESQAAYQKASQVDEAVAERLGQRASLAESMAAYQHASQLDQTVAGHLRDVTSRPAQAPASVRHEVRSDEISRTRALFQHPATARQAIIASVILGPPPGLGAAPL